MPPDAPSHCYYQAMHGAWRGAFRFALTDPAGLGRAPLSGLDRLRLRAMALQCRLGLPVWLETTVDARARPGEVLHTTRVAALGLTQFRGAEVLALHPDGLRATLRGEQRLWPALWRARPWADTPVEVDPDAAGATYHFAWLGVPMVQRTRVEPGGLRLTQQTAWTRAEVLLQQLG